MVQIKACLFDLDGVIVDTAKYHYIAWKELAQELGFDFTEEDNERLKGVSRMRSLDILLEIGNKSLSEQEKLHYADKKNVNYVSYIQKMEEDEILPGVKEFLTSLRANGIKIALGSASKNAPLILNQIGLTSYFDEIVDGNSVSKAKPDPEVFTKGANLLNVTAEECVVFEDAVAGIEAAKAGGMYCIGVGEEETLSEADFVIKGFDEMSLDRLKF
ncbi:beta-phosphoglucomutase [Halosquirtibacter laminarini]|uniref:Beta-phosphoglucomutase n=1 Tax=Halosquirtibacter laminarini TaxID=3374600 RepID=A0AC61NEK6_9BACT|nr:beta-phosphoglucomutase [Prolixibacteraceae bacterium]